MQRGFGHGLVDCEILGRCRPSFLHERVLRLIRRERLVPPGRRVLAALSGGADSVALTLLLRELAKEAGFVLVGVAHLNHRLREAADADEQFCRELAASLALPIDVERVDVGQAARRGRISLEDAGHRERYAFFRRAAARLRADRVATGHHRDDQAETCLMRLIRGAGPDGLAGIRPRAGCVVRPLLHVSRSELRTYLAGRGQPFREDETNRDPAFTRNRVRHELIPFLETRFSPSIANVLARTAEIVARRFRVDGSGGRRGRAGRPGPGRAGGGCGTLPRWRASRRQLRAAWSAARWSTLRAALRSSNRWSGSSP